MVLATQNPIDQEGTYPLPEAQLDRFLMKIFIDYPDKTTEVEIARMISTGHIDDQAAIAKSDAMLSSDQIKALQEFAASVEIDEQVLLYAVNLVRATRENASIHRGAGPRASIALLRAARAQALLNERNFVTPDDVKAVAKPVMRHRVQLAAETEIEGLTSDQVLNQVFAAVDAPRT
jgi:MoxR-like ATPase